jgi:hypothetical protein
MGNAQGVHVGEGFGQRTEYLFAAFLLDFTCWLGFEIGA